MKRRIIFILIILCLCIPLAAQSKWGGPGSGTFGGLFAVAEPASQGRTITVGGRLLPLRKINHNFNINGYVDEILVEVGDRVSVGQALVRIKRDAVGETFLPVILESRVEGVVSEIHVYETEQISSGNTAVTIIDNSAYILQASISDRDAQAIRNLGKMAVTAITSDGDSYKGRIVRTSQEPDYSTGLFNLSIEFSKQEGMFLGMVLFVDLPVEKAKGITVAGSAIVFNEGKASIWILNEDNLLTKQKVTAGEELDENVIIDSGLQIGDRYLTKPSGIEKEGLALKELVKLNMETQESGKK